MNFRLRILSVILAFFIVQGVINIPVSASEVLDSDAMIWQEALGLIGGLDIVPTSFNREDVITRGEFASFAVRSINQKGTSYELYFNDVTEDTEYAMDISKAAKLGIIKGNGNSLYMPSDNVNFQEAVKMLVSALGLDSLAIVKGGYPTGYLMLAKQLGITDGITASYTEELRFEDAVYLIYNMLTSSAFTLNSIEGVAPDATLFFGENGEINLNTYFDLYLKKGVVTDAGRFDKDGKYLSYIDIDGKEYQTLESNPMVLIGFKVLAAVKDNKAEIVILSSDNKYVDIAAEDVGSIAGLKFTFYDVDGKEKNYSLDSGYNLMRNYKPSTNVGFLIKDGYVRLIDNDGDSRYDVVNVIEPDFVFVSGFDDNVVYDENGKLYNGRLGIEIPDDVIFVDDSTREVITPDDLLPNMVLSVYTSDEGKVSFVEACYDIIHGENIVELGDDVIIIDGKEYKTNSYFDTYYPDVAPGIGGTFFFDSSGKLCAMKLNSTVGVGGMNYGYFLGLSSPSGLSAAQMYILRSDGVKQAYDLEPKLVLDDTMVSATGTEIQGKFVNGSYPNYQLIRYRLNSDQAISVIDTLVDVDSTTTDYDSIYNVDNWEITNSLTRFIQGKTSLHRTNDSFFPYVSGGSAVIFEVPQSLRTTPDALYSHDLFRVRTKSFSENEKITADYFDLNDKFQPGAIVSYAVSGGGAEPADVDVDATPMVIQNVTDASTEDGDVTKRLHLFDGSKIVMYSIDPNIIEYYKENGMPEKGDIVQFNINDYGYIDGMYIVSYNESTNTSTINYTWGSETISVIHDTAYLSGKVYSASSNAIGYIADVYPGGSSGISVPSNKFIVFYKSSSLPIIVYDTEKGLCTQGTLNDIMSVKNSGSSSASHTVLRLDWGVPDLIVVYK